MLPNGHGTVLFLAQGSHALKEQPMAHYSLVYPADTVQNSKRIDFLGEDPGRALLLAHREAGDRPAELWKDGAKLCTIKRVGGRPDYWMIGPAAS